MSRPLRLALVLLFFAGVIGAGFYGALAFVRKQPDNINFLAKHKPGTPIHLTIQTVGQMGFGRGHRHPLWVSYLTRAPNGQWIHSTQWELPAHTRIDVTEYQYDTGSPLRNQFWGKITGVVGDQYTIIPNGKTTPQIVNILNTYAGNGAAHTFTVPELGINVPFYGISGDAPNQCSLAPCSTRFAHNTIKFAFYTPGPGQYRWQCFVPCAAGFFDGNGGPMATVGYMGGWLKVQSQ